MRFEAGIVRWVNKTLNRTEALRKATILELFVSTILDTPVDEGRLRGNWQISSGSPKSGTLEVMDPTGATTVKKVEDFVRGLSPEKSAVFLTNNLPYAYRVEYDGWSHTKAPAGMVRKNFIRVSQNLKNNG